MLQGICKMINELVSNFSLRWPTLCIVTLYDGNFNFGKLIQQILECIFIVGSIKIGTHDYAKNCLMTRSNSLK